ncbi:MAG: MFS transporter [Myxococcota bacterium]
MNAPAPHTEKAAAGVRGFLGWRVVFIAFLAQLLSNTVTLSSFGVFLEPLTETFDKSVGELSRAMSIVFVVMGLSGPILGQFLDRGYARVIMPLGAAVAGGGLILMSRVEAFWLFGLLYCSVVAIGAAGFGPIPSSSLVANWFVRKRGLALGIAVAGATIAGAVGPELAAYWIENQGWRAAIFYFGLLALGLGVPAFAFGAIGRPELVGQLPDGEPVPDATDGEAVTGEAIPETSELARDPRLWMLAVGFGLIFTSPIVMTLVGIPFGRELGFSAQEAARFFTAMVPFSLFGKIAFGALADRIPPHAAIWGLVLTNLAVWALLYLEPSYPLFVATGALYGLGIGAAMPLFGVILGRCFGRLAFGRAQGLGGLATLPLVAAAPAIAGALYDATGTYRTAFLMQLALLFFGGVLLSFVRIPGDEPAETPAPAPA